MAATYKSQILNRWDWDALVQMARNDAIGHVASGGDAMCVDGCDADGHVGSSYLGSVMNNAPSGKYYTFWTTNQTADDTDRDSRWYAALDQVATKHHGWIESGEGDPTDLYFCRYFGS